MDKAHKNKKYFWSKEEIKILKKSGSILKPVELAKKLNNKPIFEIYKQRKKLNILGPYQVHAWSEKEINRLKKIGHKYSAKELVKFFKNKSELKISRKRKELGISIDFSIAHGGASKREISIIKKNISLEDKEIAKLLKNRNRGFVLGVRLKLGLTKRDKVEPFPKYFNQWYDPKLNKNKSLRDFDFKTRNSELMILKCPIYENHIFEKKAGHFRASYDRFEKINCPYCRGKLAREDIKRIVSSLIDALPHLNEQQRWVFFQQTGLLEGNNKFKNLIKAVVANKFPLSELEKFVNDQDSLVDEFSEDREFTSSDILNKEDIQDNNNKTISDVIDINEIDKIQTFNLQSKDNTVIPKVRSKDFLKAIDNTTNLLQSDSEAVEYLLVSGTDILWKDVFIRQKAAVNEIKKFKGGEYVTTIRNNFLSEYEQALSLQISDKYRSHKPNLMQKLTAVRVKNNKRVGNFSGTGAGKTISAILSANVTNSKFIVITCPNAVVNNWAKNVEECFPGTPVLTKEFNESFVRQRGQKFLVLNYEYFQQPNSGKKVRAILDAVKIDMIIIDEIHYTKQRTAENISKRKEMIKNLVIEAGNQNKNLKVIGMSATPVINNLYEGRTMIEMITGKSYDDLDTKPNIPNCMKVYQILTTLGTRQMPEYDMQLTEKIIEVDATDYLDEIKSKVGKHNILQLEQILTKARLPIILEKLKPPTLIYTHMVDGITDQLTEALEKNSYRVGMYTGEDKTGFDQFIKGHIDVLIGSSAVGTGVDGLQNVSNQLIMNVLPWTNAEFEQLKGRIYRQGQKRNVEVIIPITTIDFEGESKSWCKDKLERIKFKKTLADAAVDGIVPEETIRTEMQVFEDLRKWINRLSDDEIIDFKRKDLVSTLFTEDQDEQEKRLRKYGDFSAMNSRWNITNSAKTHDRLKKNSKEWVHYHELYRQSREKWIKTPYKEMIKYYSKRNGLHIGDFGCGEAFLYEALHDKHTVHSFDHIAINENVVEADLASIPLKDESLDVVIFSLALMGRNFDDYIKEAARVLKLDGTLRIIESTNRFNDLEAFKNALYHFGFDDILSKDMWKFTEIKGLRSDRELGSKLDIKF